ncbi:hypothetical protein HNP73_001405 [Amaricoccus macauensis]|uniref:Uncharacterized protein n=1 Tax=Amaricoccus macauensis TaxID=57001 RepID=A0A840SKI4_9RHOB|nr:hypothetical protein [Amaricoccus macauensis]MBB5221484.1 hypothetical protein [Amaricoccus macauensis]
MQLAVPSSNALRVFRRGEAPAPARIERLRAVTGTARALAAQPPIEAATLAVQLDAEHGIAFAAAAPAPASLHHGPRCAPVFSLLSVTCRPEACG